MKVILASSSPRRIELLHTIFKEFTIIKPTFNESLISKDTKQYALIEAINKKESLKDQVNYEDLVISADTIVFFKNKIYGKPKDINEAKEFLRTFSNNTHEVITGYSLTYKDKKIEKESVTYVTFNKLTDDLIDKYASEVNLLDKAGAYAIQDDEKYHIINKIKGSYYNVMGFPIEDIKKDIETLLS